MNDPGLDAPIARTADNVETEREQDAQSEADGNDSDEETYLKPRCGLPVSFDFLHCLVLTELSHKPVLVRVDRLPVACWDVRAHGQRLQCLRPCAAMARRRGPKPVRRRWGHRSGPYMVRPESLASSSVSLTY